MLRGLFSLLLLFCSPTFAQTSKGLVLVYQGAGGCEGCSEPWFDLFKSLGYFSRMVGPGQLTESNLTQAVAYVQPGGEDEILVEKALTKQEMQNIRAFVARGGRYLGVCLGGYFAGQVLSDQKTPGLGLFPMSALTYSVTKEARPELIQWKDQKRWLFFQDGPSFRPTENSKIQKWAFYADGSVAAFQTQYQQGKVGIIGPHPEADQSWWDEEKLTDPDGLDQDLARDFIEALMR